MKPGLTISIFFLLMIVPSFNVHCQDLLVTRDGDSLNCKITKVRDNYFYFTYRQNGLIRKTLLPFIQVAYYDYNHFEIPEVPVERIGPKNDFPRFRIAANAGWSYRIGRLSDKVPAEAKDYINELRSGYNFGFDLAYYFRRNMGIGFRYNMFKSKNEADDLFISTVGQVSKISDNINIDFIGPYFSSRYPDRDKKVSLLMDLGIGYLGYTDKGELGPDLFSIKGATLGIGWNLGLDINLSAKLSLCFQLTYLSGVLTTYKLTNAGRIQTVKLDKEDYENLSHFNLSAGISFQ